MKIVHVIDYFQPKLGFQEYFLAKYQKKQGHDVAVITSDRFYPFLDFEENFSDILGSRIVGSGKKVEEDIKVSRLRVVAEYKKSGQLILKSLYDALKKASPDIVHCHCLFSVSGFLCAFFKKKLGFRLIYDTHAAEFNTNFSSSVSAVLYKKIFLDIISMPLIKKRADGIFAVSQPEKEFLIRHFNFASKDIRIINLGVDTGLFRKSLKLRRKIRKELRISQKKIVIVFSGKLLPGKGIGLLIESLEGISESNIVLLLVGAGEKSYMRKLENMISVAKLQVLRKGFVKNCDLPAYFSAADIAVWPQNPSISMLEAMSCSLPLITPKTDSTMYLDESQGVVFFRSAHAESLREVLIKLINSKEIRVKIGQSAGKYIKNEKSWELITKKVINFYKNEDNI